MTKRIRNSPEYKAYQKKWHAEYRLRNKDKINESKRNNYRKNNELMIQKARKWREENPKRYIQTYLKSAARDRSKQFNLPFDLTLDDIQVPEYCPILPWIKIKTNSESGPSDSSPSIDRIKPELGYVKTNIQIISMRANILKGSASIKELKALAKWIDTLQE